MFVRAATLFLGAFLSFQVQPLIAKALLPWFGGAPAVWTTCMLFFQCLLLAGYAYAHASVRWLTPRAQAALHLALVAVALLALPIAPNAASAPSGSSSPILALLALLVATVALPYFVLCATTPLVQAWAARDAGAKSPYRLFALSNVGSMLALLSYPIAVEPLLATGTQARVWSFAFGVFAILCAACVRGVWSAPKVANAADDAAAPASTTKQRAAWLALPACASTLLLGVTNQMCQEVAVVPLLWIVPLALYLFSFVLCFESDRWYSRSWCLPVLILTLIVLTQALALGARVGVLYGVPVYSAGLFVCCMFCHGELAALRPAPRHLTSFYLSIAVGGALGGAFVSVVAPLVFRGFDELYVGLLACGVLAAVFHWKSSMLRAAGRVMWQPTLPALLISVAMIGAAFGTRLLTRGNPRVRELRNFYGAQRVTDGEAPDASGPMRYLTHGATRHGQQYLDDARRTVPTTYFSRGSGIGLLLDELSPRGPLRFGCIGLGAGVLAAYGRAGDVYRFYEINSEVVDVAQREFTFLADSPAAIEIELGDARLSLARETPQNFDVFVLDAFSSGAIPAHLLTVEAFELYARHLAPDGVLALHVSTRHLDLAPLVAAIAHASGKHVFEIHTLADDSLATLDARWLLVAATPMWLARPRLRDAGQPIELTADAPRVWTDDYSNLLGVLK